MMTSLHIIFSVAKLTTIRILRRPITLSFSLVQPMMWMLFFGFLFERFSLGQLDNDMTYIDFLLPGVCGMTVLFGASQSGVEIIRHIQTGFLNRILRSPANRMAILFGKILADTVRLMLQALAVCLLGTLLGVNWHIDPVGVIFGVLSLSVFAFAFASISCLIAIKARVSETMATFIHLVNMPMLFTSTALVPEKQMPAWLESIAQWNPLTVVVNYLREGMILGRIYESKTGLVLLLILAIVLFLFASMALNKTKIE